MKIEKRARANGGTPTVSAGLVLDESARDDMTAPTVDTPLTCPDCGNELRHVAGEDWACSRCKDPQTQSGERYWRVVAPTAAELLTTDETLRAALRDALDALEVSEQVKVSLARGNESLRTQVNELESHLLAARREVEALRETLRYFVECHSIQGTADSERYDRAIALLNRAAATPEEKKLNRMQKRAAKAQHECDDWNADVVMGTPVTVRRDDGTLFETRTRSRAFEICGHASVLVDGISGGYALERVTVRQAAAATQETR